MGSARAKCLSASANHYVSTEPEARSAELMIRTKDSRERLWSLLLSPGNSNLMDDVCLFALLKM